MRIIHWFNAHASQSLCGRSREVQDVNKWSPVITDCDECTRLYRHDAELRDHLDVP